MKLIRCITPDKVPLEEESHDNNYILKLINLKVRSLQAKLEKKASEIDQK